MFKILLENIDIKRAKFEILPPVFDVIKNEVLKKRVIDGYEVKEGVVEINDELVDLAYYYDMSRKSFKMKLVVGLKEVEGGTEIRCNSIYYPANKRYLLYAAIIAGVLVGTLAGWYLVESSALELVGIIATDLVSIISFSAINYYTIRYFYNTALKISAGGDSAKLTANLLVDDVQKVMGELLVPSRGRFMQAPGRNIEFDD